MESVCKTLINGNKTIRTYIYAVHSIINNFINNYCNNYSDDNDNENSIELEFGQ